MIRSRRPLSSTEKRKSRFTITIDDGAATNRAPALPPDADLSARSLSPVASSPVAFLSDAKAAALWQRIDEEIADRRAKEWKVPEKVQA